MTRKPPAPQLKPTDRLSQTEDVLLETVNALWAIHDACGGTGFMLTPRGVVELVRKREAAWRALAQ